MLEQGDGEVRQQTRDHQAADRVAHHLAYTHVCIHASMKQVISIIIINIVFLRQSTHLGMSHLLAGAVAELQDRLHCEELAAQVSRRRTHILRPYLMTSEAT